MSLRNSLFAHFRQQRGGTMTGRRRSTKKKKMTTSCKIILSKRVWRKWDLFLVRLSSLPLRSQQNFDLFPGVRATLCWPKQNGRISLFAGYISLGNSCQPTFIHCNSIPCFVERDRLLYIMNALLWPFLRSTNCKLIGLKLL